MLFSRGKKRAILFADVAGSSALYKSEGDVKAKSVIDQMLLIMRKHTQFSKGRVVKTIGDEIMASFETCDDACNAAIAIQKASEDVSSQHQVAIRIGIGYGKALKDDNDLFGESVNDAAFVTGVAKGSQVVMTSSVYEHLSQELKDLSEEFDEIVIKGGTETSVIYRLAWNAPSSGYSETQVLTVQTVNQHLERNAMRLTFRGRSFIVRAEETPFIIGRSRLHVALFIDSELVSRDHCHIEFRRGKFVLIDRSTNGTYIKPYESQEIYLRREELPLLGKGTISLGVSNESQVDDLIEFEI